VRVPLESVEEGEARNFGLSQPSQVTNALPFPLSPTLYVSLPPPHSARVQF